MITLIGTGHVFDLTQPLLRIFDEKQPDVLCLELDKNRYQAMMMRKTDPEGYKEASKDQPIVYKLLARFQNNMAKEYGVEAGQEMITAADYAQSHHTPLAFIDMNAQNLFSRMLKEMTIREKIKMALSGFSGIFISKKKVEKELDKIQGEFDSYIKQVGKNFPTVKRILIDERNAYMIQQLRVANEQYERVIAVVGDGHIPGIAEMLKEKNIDFETIRLKELRERRFETSDSSSASFSIEHKEP